MKKILLIDDDVELTEMLRDYLEQDGFAVRIATNGEDGTALALSGLYHLAVLDVMMPRSSGLDALQRIRARSQLPVLMLTARGDDSDRILGLELGADDYVAKPCSPRELAARVRAILRRSDNVPMDNGVAAPLAAGELLLWSEQRRIECGASTVELTSTEFNLLEVLMRHAGHTVSKNELSELALGRPMARFDRNIDVHMSSIRQKLALHSERPIIQTIFRLGYQLVKG